MGAIYAQVTLPFCRLAGSSASGRPLWLSACRGWPTGGLAEKA